MEEKRKEEMIAIFKYGIIAPVLHSDGKGQMSYFRGLEGKELNVPILGPRSYKIKTFKHWLREYRLGGLDALKPKMRSDKGIARKITQELGEIIRAKCTQYSFLSCAALYRILISEGYMMGNYIAEETLRRYIKENDLLVTDNEEKVSRKRYEREHIGELWIADFWHGPYFILGGRKRKVYLCGIIDDHSRVIVGGRFFLAENSLALEATLKDAILRYGLPKMLYCDNGAVFSSHHLQAICARLKIALVHSKPYDSRGTHEGHPRSGSGHGSGVKLRDFFAPRGRSLFPLQDSQR